MPAIARVVALALLGFCTLLPAVPATAQPAASKPIRFVVPFGAGGSGDTLARTIGQHLSKRIGQPVVVENRTGAGGNIGAEAVARAEPDGTTLLMAANYLAIAPHLHTKMTYDPIKDLAPVTYIGALPMVLVVNVDVPAKTVTEFIAHAKAKPGLAYGTPGIGTTTHLGTEQFAQMTGTELRHVPYRANPLAMNDLLGGQISFFFDFVTTGAPHVRAGKVRGLATTGATRSPILPDLPTVSEAGVPDFELSTWLAVFTTGGTPRATVDALHKEIAAILAMPEVNERLVKLGYNVAAEGPDQLGALLKSATERWAAVVGKAGIKPKD